MVQAFEQFSEPLVGGNRLIVATKRLSQVVPAQSLSDNLLSVALLFLIVHLSKLHKLRTIETFVGSKLSEIAQFFEKSGNPSEQA
jgi:hypothetical protein